MKFGAILTLAALPAVFGAAVEKRLFGSEIVASIKNVEKGVNAVDAQVLKVNSADTTQLLAVYSASNDLSATLSTETANVKKQKPLDAIGALNVQLETSNLIKAVQKLSKDIIGIKKYVYAAGVQSVVLQSLQSQKTGADAFADAITAKVPKLLQFIAVADKKQVDEALDEAIKAYSASSA